MKDYHVQTQEKFVEVKGVFFGEGFFSTGTGHSLSSYERGQYSGSNVSAAKVTLVVDFNGIEAAVLIGYELRLAIGKALTESWKVSLQKTLPKKLLIQKIHDSANGKTKYWLKSEEKFQNWVSRCKKYREENKVKTKRRTKKKTA